MNRRLQELSVLLKANQKQAALLGALLVVALGLTARAVVKSVSQQGATFAAGAETKSTSVNPVAVSARKREANIVHLPPLAPLMRDLFQPTPAELALSAQTDQSKRKGAKSPEFHVENPNGEGDINADRAAMARLVREEAARLTLRSVLLGANPVAVIAGAANRQKPAVLKKGQRIEGFELVEIHQRQVALRKDGVTVTLTIGGR